MKIAKVAVIVLSIIGLTACSSFGKKQNKMAVGDVRQFYGVDMTPEHEKELMAQRVYYFDFDRYNVHDQDVASVYAHAKRLLESPHKRVRLEGHTDKLGSREYNIALGERRADSVADILMLKGVPQEQISVVSYGKEKPVVLGDSEEARSQNRRVAIVYEVE